MIIVKKTRYIFYKNKRKQKKGALKNIFEKKKNRVAILKFFIPSDDLSKKK